MFLDDPELQKDIFMAAVENPKLRTSLFHMASTIQKASRIFESHLEEMFVDKELDRKVRELKFDLMIVYGYWFFAKAYLFPHRYAVPYVSIVLDMQQLAGVPMLPSFVPSLAITAKCSDNMSLSQRMLNIVPYVLLKHSLQPITPELSQKHAPGRPYMSTPELMAESELWIVDGGQPAIDHVKPSLPNVKYLGGLMTRPAKPLPKDLETFLKRHDHGVVLVSFGSLVKYMPDRVVQELFEAFKNVPYGVIWKYNGQPLKNVPGHVKIMSWMPQNDILGHPNTKLFITHAGNNGQMEALYHGVPMISIPLFGDQDYNAARAEQKGIAITMDAAFLKSEDLISAINIMMQNETYAKNMRRASAIFRDQPGTPVELAGFWIDHVIKYGGSYMKSHARLLPWYQFYMLDVMLGLGTMGCSWDNAICNTATEIPRFLVLNSSHGKE
ncbi:UDP-glucuronosyltransferase 2C1-like [Lingula anatina]|uniref:UDP-glucuronosyltransferase n=1 Tax=Lingula anatina TaxID=7574 RepID=A0A1S3JSS4_LINAN|nr:UDP-glucuronosyltransferase 2C1-like [Lingula anatina]|eukprot:XP_013413403.1 UDP-glucuronosyltransferase 2C1-like [Lingula anatina]